MENKSKLSDLKIAQQELILHHKQLAKCAYDLKIANENLDIGESEREKRLIEVNEDLENMMFAISHKLRKSIAKIIGISNLLCGDHTLDDAELREMLGIIISSAESLNNSTEELSVFIRLKRG